MTFNNETGLNKLREDLGRLRGNPEHSPDASVIVPVNAQSDLPAALEHVRNLARYTGKYAVEVVLVINNYPPENPPEEIRQFRDLGVRVVAVPDARRPGEVVILTARALGVDAARSNVTIHFDADCRIPNITALLDWYIHAFHTGAKLAYSHVDYYDLRNLVSVRVKIAIHHLSRWLKRNILSIPTTRGSNYAVDRSLFMQLYEAGRLSVDLQVGPAVKLAGGRIVYSGDPSLRVFTSGRRFRGGWFKMIPYFYNRLHYNLKAIPTPGRPVTRTSWQGFDQETYERQLMMLPGQEESARGGRS